MQLFAGVEQWSSGATRQLICTRRPISQRHKYRGELINGDIPGHVVLLRSASQTGSAFDNVLKIVAGKPEV